MHLYIFRHIQIRKEDYRYLRCLRFMGPLFDDEPANCRMDELVDADVDGESSLSWTSGESAFSSIPVKSVVNQSC